VDSAQTSGALVAMAIFAKGRITGKITSDLLFLAFFSTFFFFFLDTAFSLLSLNPQQ
jgi:hypothetical protein